MYVFVKLFQKRFQILDQPRVQHGFAVEIELGLIHTLDVLQFAYAEAHRQHSSRETSTVGRVATVGLRAGALHALMNRLSYSSVNGLQWIHDAVPRASWDAAVEGRRDIAQAVALAVEHEKSNLIAPDPIDERRV